MARKGAGDGPRYLGPIRRPSSLHRLAFFGLLLVALSSVVVVRASAVTAEASAEDEVDRAIYDILYRDRSAFLADESISSPVGMRGAAVQDVETESNDIMYEGARPDLTSLFEDRRRLAAESNETLEPIIDALRRRLIGTLDFVYDCAIFLWTSNLSHH